MIQKIIMIQKYYLFKDVPNTKINKWNIFLYHFYIHICGFKYDLKCSKNVQKSFKLFLIYIYALCIYMSLYIIYYIYILYIYIIGTLEQVYIYRLLNHIDRLNNDLNMFQKSLNPWHCSKKKWNILELLLNFQLKIIKYIK